MPFEGAPNEKGALYVPVTLYSEDNKRRWMGNALVDTGAQFAMIHPSVAKELDLVARGERDIDSAVGLSRSRAYLLRAAVADVCDDIFSALETQSKERFVIGRQILSKTRLEVDWPLGKFRLARAP